MVRVSYRFPLVMSAIAGFAVYNVLTPSRSVFDIWYGDTHHKGPREMRRIALTFDDGPSPLYTEPILQILETHNVKATFFMIGEKVLQYPKIARRVADLGHSIGNHTYSHRPLPLMTTEEMRFEIELTNQIILDNTGLSPTVVRPPRGHRDPRVLQVCRDLGYPVVMWSVTALDWASPGTELIIKQTVRACHNGAIILFHDGLGGHHHARIGDSALKRIVLGVSDRTQTIHALARIIPSLLNDGYELVSVPDLLNPLYGRSL